MARDYAQRGGGRRQARGRSGGGTPGWIWLAVGLAIGLAFAAFVYIKRPASPLPALRKPRPRPRASPTSRGRNARR